MDQEEIKAKMIARFEAEHTVEPVKDSFANKPVLTKHCPECGCDFQTRKPHKKYCSEKCAKAANHKNINAHNAKTRTVKGETETVENSIETTATTAVIKQAPVNSYLAKVREEPAPHLDDTNLVNYIIELEQDVSNIRNINEHYKSLIDGNNIKIAWTQEIVDRLKHIQEVADKK